MKKIILFIIVLAAGIALGIYFQKQPKAQNIEGQVQTDAAQAGAEVKAGVQTVEAAGADAKTNLAADIQKSKAIATNVVADVKAGAQKVSEFTTNAAGEIKEKIP